MTTTITVHRKSPGVYDVRDGTEPLYVLEFLSEERPHSFTGEPRMWHTVYITKPSDEGGWGGSVTTNRREAFTTAVHAASVWGVGAIEKELQAQLETLGAF